VRGKKTKRKKEQLGTMETRRGAGRRRASVGEVMRSHSHSNSESTGEADVVHERHIGSQTQQDPQAQRANFVYESSPTVSLTPVAGVRTLRLDINKYDGKTGPIRTGNAPCSSSSSWICQGPTEFDDTLRPRRVGSPVELHRTEKR